MVAEKLAMVPWIPVLRPGTSLETAGLCSRCLFSLTTHRATSRRTFVATRVLQNGSSQGQAFPKILRKAFFSSNGFANHQSLGNEVLKFPRRQLQSTNTATTSLFDSTAPTERQGPSVKPESLSAENEVPPHRRRQRLKSDRPPTSDQYTIRPDASARLSSLSSSLPTTSLRRILATYLSLTKPQLSFLIVLTATTAYGLYPIPALLTLDSSVAPLPTLSTSTLTFLYLSAGTFLSCASANTLNMLLEPQFDARMSRTRNRPLVRKLLSTRAAVLFAIGTGTVGIAALYMGTNPTVAGLSAFNLCLYAFVYTPLKRISVVNTWVGAIVGGIPPLMGWTAAAGQSATTGHDTWKDLLFGPGSAGGWLLAAILYAWQFPHFNSLSHTIREEYKNAGYRMLAWTNPAMNARVALRYSILMFPVCAGLWWVGVVNKGFLVGGTLVNSWLAKRAYDFWKLEGAKGSARGLFWASVWHLPLLMVGTLVMKTGVWDGVLNRLLGIGEVEDEFEDDGTDFEEYHENIQKPAARTSVPSSPIVS